MSYSSMEELNESANISERTHATSVKSTFDEDDTKALIKYQEYLKSTYKLSDEMAGRVSVAIMGMNDGLADIIENYEDYEKALQKANRGTEDYVTSLEKVKKDFALILDLDTKDISEDFATSTENLQLMKAAANGSLAAITQLRENAANAIITDVKVEDKDLQDDLQKIKDTIINSEAFEDLEIGARIDDTAFVDSLNKLIESSNLTVEEAQKILNSLGFEPSVEYEKVSYEQAQKYQGEVMVPDGKGGYKVATQELLSKTNGEFYIPKINGSKTTYRGSPQATVSAANKAAAAKNAGSAKESKSVKKESERYHVIKEVIEDINHELDKLGDAKDRAFGSKKLKAINDETAALESLLAAEKQYKKEVEDYYKKDKAAIAAYGAKFDENGIITNYEDLIQQQVNKYNASKTDEAEKAYEKFKEALEQYEETHDLLQDQEKKIRDAENKIRDNILEGIQAKVDIQIEVNDDDIAFLDHLLGNLEDSAYDAAEAIAYLGQQTAANLKSNKAYIQGINDIFASQGIADAADRFISGELTAADLKEMEFTEDEVAALKEYRDGLMETTEQLQELRDTI